MNGWNPEIPAGNRVDEPPRHAETRVNIGNAALSGVMLVALSASVYGAMKAGALDVVIGAFQTSSKATETTTEVSQAPKIVKPIAKDVGETTVGSVGEKVTEGIEKIVEAELGPAKDWYRNKAREQLLEPQDSRTSIENIIIPMIRDQLGVKPEDRPKDFDIIFNPETSNKGTEEYIKAVDEVRKELQVEVDGFAEEILRRGHTDREGAEILENFVESRHEKKPIEEIEPGIEQKTKNYYEERTGLPWR